MSERLEDMVDAIGTALRYPGKFGLGWYVRLEGQGEYAFGHTMREAIEAARAGNYISKPQPATTRRRVVEDDAPVVRRRVTLFD